MELNVKKTSSQALLSCGNGGGLSDKLLLKPKAGRSLQTECVPRSSVLDRLQTFLPQMAEANEKLKRQMEEAPAGHFDIESVEEAERVIEMVSISRLVNQSFMRRNSDLKHKGLCNREVRKDVALVELSGAGSSSEDYSETSDSEEESDCSDNDSEITEQNLKLPGDKGKKNKFNIQVLDLQGE